MWSRGVSHKRFEIPIVGLRPVLLSSRKVIVLEDPQAPIFKSLSLSLSLNSQVLDDNTAYVNCGNTWLCCSADYLHDIFAESWNTANHIQADR